MNKPVLFSRTELLEPLPPKPNIMPSIAKPWWVWLSAVSVMLGVSIILLSPLRVLGQASSSHHSPQRKPNEVLMRAVPDAAPVAMPLKPIDAISPLSPPTAASNSSAATEVRKEGKLNNEQRQQLRQQVIDASKHHIASKQSKKTN